ncbi:hypothetical protein HDU87_001675 [Geranomyces variabilis]|uniref:Uncharacterized protein n=1 Tax=Geranomyces variabilis TaxID=109894 RepID=A0AAD5XI31_9FUNG|nr:hypothetical protein HDU87_001675 [Geranomyces variabilis]
MSESDDDREEAEEMDKERMKHYLNRRLSSGWEESYEKHSSTPQPHLPLELRLPLAEISKCIPKTALESLPQIPFEILMEYLNPMARYWLSMTSRVLHSRVPFLERDFIRDFMVALTQPGALDLTLLPVEAHSHQDETTTAEPQHSLHQLEHWSSRLVALLHDKWLPRDAHCVHFDLRNAYAGFSEGESVDIRVEVPLLAGDRALFQLTGTRNDRYHLKWDSHHDIEIAMIVPGRHPAGQALLRCKQEDHRYCVSYVALAWQCLGMRDLRELLEFIPRLFPQTKAVAYVLELSLNPRIHKEYASIHLEYPSHCECWPLACTECCPLTCTSAPLQSTFRKLITYLQKLKRVHQPKPFDSGYPGDFLLRDPFGLPEWDFWDDDGTEWELYMTHWDLADSAIRALVKRVRLMKGVLALEQFGLVYQHIWDQSPLSGTPSKAAERAHWVKNNVHVQECDLMKLNGSNYAQSRDCRITIKASVPTFVSFTSQAWLYIAGLGERSIDGDDQSYVKVQARCGTEDATLLAQAPTVWHRNVNGPPMQLEADACLNLAQKLGVDWTPLELALVLFAVGFAATAWPCFDAKYDSIALFRDPIERDGDGQYAPSM